MYKNIRQVNGPVRMLLWGLSSTGKSFTSMEIAAHLYPGVPFAVIDSENKAWHYGDRYPQAQVYLLEDFAPESYIKAIQAVPSDVRVLVIDGLSDAWSYVKSIVRREKNTQRGWGNATPHQERLQQAIGLSPCHIVATCRALENEKQEVCFIQRQTITFEFSTRGWMDSQHALHVQHAYAPQLRDKAFPRPGKNIADILRLYHGIDDNAWQFRARVLERWSEVVPELIGDKTGIQPLLDLAGVSLNNGFDEQATMVELAVAVDGYVEQRQRDNGDRQRR